MYILPKDDDVYTPRRGLDDHLIEVDEGLVSSQSSQDPEMEDILNWMQEEDAEAEEEEKAAYYSQKERNDIVDSNVDQFEVCKSICHLPDWLTPTPIRTITMTVGSSPNGEFISTEEKFYLTISPTRPRDDIPQYDGNNDDEFGGNRSKKKSFGNQYVSNKRPVYKRFCPILNSGFDLPAVRESGGEKDKEIPPPQLADTKDSELEKERQKKKQKKDKKRLHKEKPKSKIDRSSSGNSTTSSTGFFTKLKSSLSNLSNGRDSNRPKKRVRFAETLIQPKTSIKYPIPTLQSTVFSTSIPSTSASTATISTIDYSTQGDRTNLEEANDEEFIDYDLDVGLDNIILMSSNENFEESVGEIPETPMNSSQSVLITRTQLWGTQSQMEVDDFVVPQTQLFSQRTQSRKEKVILVDVTW